MAVYRFSAKVVKRSEGRSATAAAAYRAAEELHDERLGFAWDYTRRAGVLHAEIVAPENAPEWMRDREQLWNAVERVEKRSDAQLAREIQLSLPHELNHAQRLDLVREFVRSEFVDHGMIADFAIHAPDRGGDNRNHHAHVLLTMRELTGEGFGIKNREWNDKDRLEAWRENWANAVNHSLERNGFSERVDHRSYADRGIDREAEPKQGPIATEMEREGRPSHAGDDRRAVKERNAEREALREALEATARQIEALRQSQKENEENRQATTREPSPAFATAAERTTRPAANENMREPAAAAPEPAFAQTAEAKQRPEPAIDRVADQAMTAAEKTIDSASHAFGNLFGRLGRAVETVVNGISSFITETSTLTRDQAERMAKEAREKQTPEPAREERPAQNDSRSFAERFGTFGPAPTRDRSRDTEEPDRHVNPDMHDHQQEQKDNRSFVDRFGVPPLGDPDMDREPDDDRGRERERSR